MSHLPLQISTGSSLPLVRHRTGEPSPEPTLSLVPTRELAQSKVLLYQHSTHRAKTLRPTMERVAVKLRLMLAQIIVLPLSTALCTAPAQGQWVTTFETFYLQAPHNWTFRNNYQHADRMFNAFDYGHAILYETLFTKPQAPASVLEDRIYNKLTQEVLVSPPRVPLEEAAIEPMYARLAPEAKMMFDWSHILHRQIYDVLASERMTDAAKDAEVQRLLAYYKTRPDLAFSSQPKSMELMQEQPYSLAFRQKYPKFNGLIWGYHWLQVGLYEPLVVGTTSAERQAGVRATVARFWQMLQDPLKTLPYQMPMTAAVSPEFAKRFPEAAIIFDNLHSMHDVVSDILVNPSVPRTQKRAEILRAGRLFRDDTSYVMPEAGWRTMSLAMGVENMGGQAFGFSPALPTPSVTKGAVMQHDRQSGRMTAMKVGQMIGMSHGGMDHDSPPNTPVPQAPDHAGHGTPAQARPLTDSARHAAMGHLTSSPPLTDSARHAAMGHLPPSPPLTDSARHAAMGHNTAVMPTPQRRHVEHNMMPALPLRFSLPMQLRLLRDPIIRRRVLADTTLQRQWLASISDAPAAEQAVIRQLLTPDATAKKARAPSRRKVPSRETTSTHHAMPMPPRP